MALYKHFHYLKASHEAAFDREYPPGVPAPQAGLYRCWVCGFEAVAEAGRPLPPHPHEPQQPPIRWRLLVLPQIKPDPLPPSDQTSI